LLEESEEERGGRRRGETKKYIWEMQWMRVKTRAL